MNFASKNVAGVTASLLIALSQALPVWGQAQQQLGYYAAPELQGIPGLIYDPPPEAYAVGPSLNSAPGASQAGIITSPNPGESRAWRQGAKLSEVVKFSDLDPKVNPQFAGFTKLSLRSFSKNIGTDIGGVALKDIELVNGLNLQQLKTIYGNGNIKIKDSLPVVQAMLGVVFDPRGAQQQLKNNATTFGKEALINRLNKEKALKDVPFEDLLNGDWGNAISKGEQVLLRELGNDLPEHLKRIPIGDLTISVINGDWSRVQAQAKDYAVNEIFELTLDEALERFPELQKIPVGSIAQIANQPLDQSLPQIADLALENIPGLKDKALSAVPGLGDSPVGAALGDVLNALLTGAVFAKFDVAHSGMDGPEEFFGRPLSGGTPDNKFKPIPGIKSTDSKTKKPKRGFPRWEMKPAEVGVIPKLTGDPILGKEWMDVAQQVPGCKGIMCIFGKWEPAGIKPIKSLPVKFGVADTTEYLNKPSTSRIHVSFQVCITVFFEKHCTAHIFGYKTPWKVKPGSLFPIIANSRRIQDFFPGVDTSNLTVDYSQCPTFLAGNNVQPSNLGSNPPQSEAGAFNQFKQASAGIGINFDRDAQGRLLIDKSNELATLSWIRQEAGTYGFQVQETNDSITFNYTGLTHSSPAQTQTLSNSGFSGVSSSGQILAPKLQGIPGRNSSVSTSSTATQGIQKIASNAWGNEVEVYNLIMTSVLESDGLTNQTDVAVAIMNRVHSPNHPNSIIDVVFEPDQYQPNFGSAPVSSKAEAISRLVKKSGGVQQAIAQYERLEATLNDPVKVATSQAFLKGATDFRGQSLLHNKKPGDPYRGDIGANWYLQESQDPALAAKTLGELGVSSAAIDAASVLAVSDSANASAIECRQLLASSQPGQTGIIQPEGNGIATGKFNHPVKGYPMSSDYGYRRSGFHAGVDFATPVGTPINASDGGIIEEAGHEKNYGYYVVVNHQNGYSTLYAHLSEIQVKVGHKAEQGKPIGLSGDTGRSTGPHLHFEVIRTVNNITPRRGGAINPNLFVNFHE